MLEPIPARLAYLTLHAEHPVLNLQTFQPAMFDSQNFIRLALTRAQLTGLLLSALPALLGRGE